MNELETYQYLLIALIFVWSGFVRSGLGFGGAALSLPFLLLIDNRPLIFLPIIAIHLLVFSSSTVLLSARKAKGQQGAFKQGIAWGYLRYALALMIIPKLLGVFGLITLPPAVMSSIIFAIVSVYAIGYILNRPFRSNSKWVDGLFLMLGGYISGSSLIGAPLIIAVFANHVDKHQLRDTLFILWFILVVIKMSAFIYVGIDLQLIHQLWLLPCATVGHLLGLRLHKRMLTSESPLFFRLLGSALLLISVIGLLKGVL
ncbi:TSUP family transporter [Sedimenticola sp.]|uniref:TSUP family transporter n=1 Tax=Sedimenticola sp. TaxID=1940285 RepID=UPI003D0ACEAF